MTASKIILILLTSFYTAAAFGQIEWFEPEVVAEKLTRDNRKVVRFSGTTTPDTQLRIRKNRVKMYLANGKYRWALLPQKNKNQFPVTADSSGSFAFNLYLPTVPVEIPIEVKQGRKWIPYSLNFRVPEKGVADDFEALAQSYTAAANQDSGLEPTVGEYNPDTDFGQVLPRVAGDRSTNPFAKSRFRFYLGLGAAWNNMREESGTLPVLNRNTSPETNNIGFRHDKSELTLPTWRAGVVYRKNRKWRFEGALRSTEADFEADGYDPLLFDEGAANWLELQFSTTRYLWSFDGGSQLGVDVGLQYHSVPYYRLREGVANFAYFDNDLYALHAGLRFESSRRKKWPWEVYSRLVLPISAGNAFELNSGYGVDLGWAMDRRLTPGVSVGAWAQVESLFLDTTTESFPGGNRVENQMDFAMTMVSLGAKLSVGF